MLQKGDGMKANKKFDEESLGGRIKGYEKSFETEVDPKDHIIVRIDGHHFSSFTKGFFKPFDIPLSIAMVETTKDLVERFGAYAGYTQSDEITLVLPSLKDVTVDNRKKPTHKLHKRVREDWTHSFSGRGQKIASLTASFTTMAFNKHLDNEIIKYMASISDSTIRNQYSKLYSEKSRNAYFDARVFGVPSDVEAFNVFMWRARDCVKNSKSMFAQAYCSHKELQKKNGEEQVEYCLNKTGKDWNALEDKYKYGTIVKKEIYEKDSADGAVVRSRIATLSTPLSTFSDENVKMIMGQYL